MSLVQELKRRNVFKVGAAYAVVAWLLAQIADLALSAFEAPNIIQQVFLTFLALGFPVALLLAWAYELTPNGIRPTADVEPTQSVTRRTGQKLNYAIIGLLLAGLIFVVVDSYLPQERGQVATIAVLPFENLSPESGQDSFADGFVAELQSSLAQIEDLSVTALTSSMAFRGSNLSAPEIAAELGVGYLLEGRISRNADTVRVFASLINAADGSSVWASPYDRELKDPFALQLELAETVAERLSVTFGVGDFDREAGGTTNLEAYDFYLAARGAALGNDIDAAIALFDRAVAIDPEFGLAHLYTARVVGEYLIARGATFDNQLSVGDAPQTSLIEQMTRLQQRGRIALERARALVPDSPTLALLDTWELVADRRWSEAEEAFRERLNTTARSDVDGNYYIGLFLYLTGRARQALPFLERARELDPRAIAPVGILTMVYDALGNFERAVALDAEAQTLDGYTQFWQFVQYWRLRSVGDTAAAEAVLERYDPGQAMAAMQRFYENPAEIPADSPAIYTANVAMLAAADGDVEFALEMWRRTLLGSPSNPSLGSPVHLTFVWTSLMAEMRRHPDFELLMSELNLPGYWQRYGWPEHCQPADPEGFECS